MPSRRNRLPTRPSCFGQYFHRQRVSMVQWFLGRITLSTSFISCRWRPESDEQRSKVAEVGNVFTWPPTPVSNAWRPESAVGQTSPDGVTRRPVNDSHHPHI